MVTTTFSPGTEANEVPRVAHVARHRVRHRNLIPKQKRRAERLDFAMVNAAARRELLSLLSRWLPDGRTEGHEFVARNPRRADRNPGSFKVNLRTGKWSDFATGDKGGDPVSLAAYLFGYSQIEAGRKLATMFGLLGGEAGHG